MKKLREILLGTFALSQAIMMNTSGKAQKVRGMIVHSFKEVFKEYDILISPTSPITAFDIGAMIDDPLTMYQNDICTMPANIAGIPAISIPCGISDGSVGFQIMQNFTFFRFKIINIAKEFEKHIELNILKSINI